MACRRLRVRALAAAGSLLGACASLDPEPDWRSVQALVEESTGRSPAWSRSAADVEAAGKLAAALVADGLTRDEAVQIALMNDPRLQAQFDRLGLARADYVQAGLYTNPSLGGFVGFPLRFDASAVTLLAFLSDLWLVPARRAVAEAALEEAIQRAGAAALQTLFETHQAYDTVLYQQARLALETEELELRRRSALRTPAAPRGRPERDVREEATSARVAEQEIAVAQAVRDAALARDHLLQILALPGRHLVEPLADPLSEPAEDAWSEDRAVEFALGHRLDLAAARLRVEVARRRAALARRARVSSVAVGPGYNGAFGDDDSRGPAATLELPIFDRQQANLTLAAFQQLQSEHELAALEAQAGRDVGDAMAERQLQRSQAEILRTQVLPALERVLEQAGLEGPRDLAEYLHWLQQKEQAIQARRAYVNAVWSLRQAQDEFENALYGGIALPR